MMHKALKFNCKGIHFSDAKKKFKDFFYKNAAAL